MVACVDQFRAHLTTHGEEEVTQLALPSYNLLRLNTRWGIISTVSTLGMSIISTIYRDSDSFSVFEEEDDSPLYILAGEWVAGRLLLYEDPAPAPATSASSGRCLNSSEDAAAQLAASLQARERVRSSNLETLWGR